MGPRLAELLIRRTVVHWPDRAVPGIMPGPHTEAGGGVPRSAPLLGQSSFALPQTQLGVGGAGTNPTNNTSAPTSKNVLRERF